MNREYTHSGVDRTCASSALFRSLHLCTATVPGLAKSPTQATTTKDTETALEHQQRLRAPSVRVHVRLSGRALRALWCEHALAALTTLHCRQEWRLTLVAISSSSQRAGATAFAKSTLGVSNQVFPLWQGRHVCPAT
jgi:hypothetical protein